MSNALLRFENLCGSCWRRKDLVSNDGRVRSYQTPRLSVIACFTGASLISVDALMTPHPLLCETAYRISRTEG